MNQECRRLVIPAYDLGVRTDCDDFIGPGLGERLPIPWRYACGFLFAGQTAYYDGQGLSLPVYVKDDTAAWFRTVVWIGERFPCSYQGVVCDLLD